MHNKKSKQTLNIYGKTSTFEGFNRLTSLCLFFTGTPGYLRIALLISRYNLLSD